MNFILLMAAVFSCGALLLSAGFQEDVVTLAVLLVVMIAAEIHKPDRGTVQIYRWTMAHLKWICLPLLFTL